jgi:hypothetical protein
MFNFFKKTPKPKRQADQVFMSAGAKFLSLGKTIKQLLDNQAFVIVVYFFPKTGEDLKTVLHTFNLAFDTFENQATKSNQSILLVSAASFGSARGVLEPLQKTSLHCLIAEHYPLPTEDEQLISRIGEISMDVPITFYCALDEPLFKLFGSDNIRQLMLKMGIQEEEAISHSLINQSIARAQEKIAKKVKIDFKAESTEAWFAKNTDF